jgi:formylglycine-generating enzyme required for sulfatase activity
LASAAVAIAAIASLQGGLFRVDMSPPGPTREPAPGRYLADVPASAPRDVELIRIPAGVVQIGDDTGPPDERPAFRYTSRAFLMDRTPVTVAEFAVFVKDTGYETDAERDGAGGVLDERDGAWAAVDGATWQYPRGAGAGGSSRHPGELA